ILTTGSGGAVRAVITDFGLARGTDANLRTLSSGVRGGTPDYMAPELLNGGKASIASDIYALGVILHELIYGSRPGASPGNKPKWDRIIAHCIDSDPASRFQDADQIARAFAPSRARVWWLAVPAAIALAVGTAVVTYQGAAAPKQSVVFAMLPF